MSRINIFNILNNIDYKNYQYYSELSEIEKKQVSTFMLLKWMACSNDPNKLLLLNASANKLLFELSAYPELTYHVLAVCGTGKKDFYTWIKKQPKDQKRPITVKLLKEYYNISTDDAIEDSEIMNMESAVAIAEELGEFNIISKLRSEYFNV